MVEWLDIPGFSGFDQLICGFTRRCGGVSDAPYDALNLSFHRQDPVEHVYENYNRLSQAIKISQNRIIRANQVHGKVCRLVTKAHAGIQHPVVSELDGVDSMVTNERGLVLLTTHADCVPLFFYDPVHQAIGLAHAGWSGALKGVVEETVEIMHAAFASDASELRVAFGPHIGSCCFEVQKDVADQFRKKTCWNEQFEAVSETGGIHICLESYLKEVLRVMGVSIENVYGTDVCTKCACDRYYSHRGSGGNTGCGAAFLGLEELYS